MNSKRVAAKSVAKTSADPLTSEVLKAASKKAFAAASERAFKLRSTLLSARDGWLVEVDRKGDVVKKVRKL